MTTRTSPTVFVVDDDDSMRRGLTRLLTSVGYAVETYPSAAAYLARPSYGGIGCLLLDVCMPGMDGLRLQEELARIPQSLPIVFLTAREEVPLSVRALKRGAVDFLVKPVDESTLLDAIRAALARRESEVAARAAVEEAREKIETLTSREREVLRGVISGALNKQIALKMGVTEATVKVHRAHVMQKLGASSVVDLVAICEKAGEKPVPV